MRAPQLLENAAITYPRLFRCNTIADLSKTVEQKHQLRDKGRHGKRTPVGKTLKKLK